MPFSLTEVVNDPDLAEEVTIVRTTVKFGLGGVQETSVNIPAYGVLTVASPKELKRIPEGDRLTGSIMFNCSQIIYQTHEGSGGNDPSRLSDQIIWRGLKYKVVSVSPWVDFGFWQAILLRTEGT